MINVYFVIILSVSNLEGESKLNQRGLKTQ